MVGAFPPPMHGMAAVNATVRDRIVEARSNPIVIDVSANSLSRSLFSRLGRLPKVMRGIAWLMFSRQLRDDMLYMTVSGGFGQIYEVLFMMLGRLRRMRLYMHHHSFAYLDRTNWLTRVLTAVAGPATVHITLSPGMAAHLEAQYSSVRRLMPISNTVFLAGNASLSGIVRHSLKTIGFISNISAEKGVFEFLDLVEACEAQGLQLRATLGGPFQDTETEYQVRQRLGELHNIEYVGPQYGNDKESFFDSIDALIFPTRYVNEAEPLTIHEAMQRALPVIAYGRGCIPEIVGSDCGLVIDPENSFVPAAVGKISQWLESPEAYRTASRAAGEHFAMTLEENTRRWDELLREILNSSTDARNVFQHWRNHH